MKHCRGSDRRREETTATQRGSEKANDGKSETGREGDNCTRETENRRGREKRQSVRRREVEKETGVTQRDRERGREGDSERERRREEERERGREGERETGATH